MPFVTPAARAAAALDKAFDVVFETHFAGFVLQVDSSGGGLKANTEHFRNGMRDLKAAFEAAEIIVDEVFGAAQ